MKKLLKILLILIISILPCIGCSFDISTIDNTWFFDESIAKYDGKKAAEQILVNLQTQNPISYSEIFFSEEYKEEYIFNRDSKGNISINIITTYLDSSLPESYSYYYVDNVCYYFENDEFIETIEDFNEEEFFSEDIQYIYDMTKYYGLDSFDPTIEANYSSNDDKYIITGEYEDMYNIYIVEIAKDYSSMSAIDHEYDITLSFKYDKTIELPFQDIENMPYNTI